MRKVVVILILVLLSVNCCLQLYVIQELKRIYIFKPVPIYDFTIEENQSKIDSILSFPDHDIDRAKRELLQRYRYTQ